MDRSSRDRSEDSPVALGRLVKWIDGRTRHCSALERLALAVEVGGHLETAKDELVGHFVEQARASGETWSQIGEQLGVTKQAAQQRHVDRAGLLDRRKGRRDERTAGLFTRFTDRARTAVALAQDEARRLDHDYVGTEHILLGLLAEHEGVAGVVLGRLGVSLEKARAQVEETVGRGSGPPAGTMRFAPRAKKVLQIALAEARRLGSSSIGTEHLLLATTSERSGVGAEILLEHGIDQRSAREAVTKELSSRSDPSEGG
jgi:hypothetical protein